MKHDKDYYYLLERIEFAERAIERLCILYCPSCGHETVQIPTESDGHGTIALFAAGSYDVSHRCLSCGKKIFHRNEMVHILDDGCGEKGKNG